MSRSAADVLAFKNQSCSNILSKKGSYQYSANPVSRQVIPECPQV